MFDFYTVITRKDYQYPSKKTKSEADNLGQLVMKHLTGPNDFCSVT